jgi:DNA-3-methyladenine glycosylase I
MQAPTQITPSGLSDYLDVITRAVFQSGMSWRVVEAKWAGFREAFAGFDPAVVAAYTDDDVERLVADKGIIRNRRKIEATVSNAQAMLTLEDESGGFVGWLRGRGDFEATVAALRAEFRFLGDMGAYYFLYVVGENVPTHEEWMASHPDPGRR